MRRRTFGEAVKKSQVAKNPMTREEYMATVKRLPDVT